MYFASFSKRHATNLSWEQRKFVSVFDGLQNNTLSRAELNYESGTIKNVHYGDVLIKFGDYIDASQTELPYISDDAKADKFKNSFLQDGDIIIADTAEDDTVGKCTEIRGSEGMKLLSGLHTIACRPKEKYGPMFLGYYINSPAYHNQLKPLMQGIKVTSISKSALQDTDMIIPKSIDEQIKIGEYFSNLDNLITLHQCKHNYTPIAFALQKTNNSTPSWEQRKLGDLINETRDKTTVEDEDTLLSCAIDGMFLNSELFSHFRGSSNIGYLKVKKNDLILSAQNLHLGNCNVNLRFEHGIISPAYKVYELIECDPLFIQAWVKQDKTKDFFLKASTEGASVCRKNIVWEELYKQELPVPKIDEQIKIGAFFENIDNLITLHQR